MIIIFRKKLETQHNNVPKCSSIDCNFETKDAHKNDNQLGFAFLLSFIEY